MSVLSQTRREFLRQAALAGLGAALGGRFAWAAAARPNVVILTADDLNFDSLGVTGGPIRDLTPNLDRLASQGMRFAHAYSTVAVCQPVREIMHTGLYPHRNGAMGFFPIWREARTLNEQLHDAGYLISMVGGKHPHYQPADKFCVGFSRAQIGKKPAELAAATKEFLALARSQGKPFFHHVNCNDPHRPFVGSEQERARGGDSSATVSRVIRPEEVTGVPGFLDDIPEVRRELAQYYTSVRRLDDCMGAVLRALEEAGAVENTVVLFYGGDHGMSLPFAKSNNYENSSRGSLFVRWPGVVRPGSVDEAHLVSTLDFTPTLLAAAGAPAIPGIDGRSFIPALRGELMPGWDQVFTFYNQTSGHRWFTMRCVRTRRDAYIWNAWSDGQTRYQAENMNGISWRAMLQAAETDPEIKKRVDFYLYRVPEEYYVLEGDPCERRNLVDSRAHRRRIETMRGQLLELLRRTSDPFAEAFARRGDPAVLRETMAKLDVEYPPPRRPARPGGKKRRQPAMDPEE